MACDIVERKCISVNSSRDSSKTESKGMNATKLRDQQYNIWATLMQNH